MKRRGPDSLEGLFVAVICCLISTLMYGSAGLASMLFVACINRYDTDRNKASLPFTLNSVLQAMSGLFCGYLAKKFSVRTVILIGAVLAPLGISLCYLAEDITVVIISWGIIFGIGFGLSTLLLPAIINDYFIKQRSKALGLCYFGSPVGFFVFPPIFEMLLDKYGLSGTFLLLSGINMHCLPLCMCLKQPNFSSNDENCHLRSGKTADSYSSTDFRTTNKVLSKAFDDTELKTDTRRFSIEFLWDKSGSKELLTKQYFLSLDKKVGSQSQMKNRILRSFKNCNKNWYKDTDTLSKSGETAEHNGNSIYLEVDNPFDRQESSIKVVDDKINKYTYCREFDMPQNKSYQECSSICVGTFTNDVIHKLKLKDQTDFNANKYERKSHVRSEVADHFSGKISSIPTLLKYEKIDVFSGSPNDKSHGVNIRTQNTEDASDVPSKSLISLYLDPIFIVMCIINAISSLHFTTLTTVIIDFSRDIGVNTEFEKYIMMCLSIMGGVGMLGFGWVTDGGYLTRTRFGSLSQLIGGIATVFLPFTLGFETLMVALSVWCVSQASFIPIIPAIIAEYFEEDIQTVAVSACFVLCGPLYMIIPPLIGYFRDDRGSYDNIFFLLGALSFANCIAVFTIPYLARWKSKR